MLTTNLDRAFIKGDNVYLRPLDVEDLEGDYIQWINDQEVTKYLDRPFPVTKEELENYLKSIHNDPNSIFFAVIEKTSNKHVGNLKIGPIDWIHRRTGFGRILSKEVWGKKYGSEIVKLMIVYIFDQLNLNRILEHNVADNKSAIKSNEKAGLDIEGTIKEYVFADGKYCDVVIVGLTRSRYLEKKKKGLF